jgi:hypothetical protein
MNKIVLSVVVVAIIAIALGTTGAVFAQSGTPQTPITGTEFDRGMGGRGSRGGMTGGNVAGTQDGLLHDEMIAIYSAKLGISVDVLNSRLANGETLSAIALSTGLTVEQFTTLRLEVRNLAIDQAVKDGTFTQEQADWMKTRSAGMGTGTGFRGNGQGRSGTADCPYSQTNP